MPFILQNNDSEPTAIDSPRSSVFIIPGIFGDADELKPLSADLQAKFSAIDEEKFAQRDIYVWHDPRQVEDSDGNMPKVEACSIPDMVKFIVQDVIEIVDPNNPYPVFMGGYSRGAGLSILAAQHLAMLGYNIAPPFAIDSLPPDELQTFFAPNNIEATSEIIAMHNALAKLAKRPEIKFSEAKVATISSKPLAVQLEEVRKAFLEMNFEDMFNNESMTSSLMTFHHYARVIAENITATSEYKEDTALTKLKAITVIYSGELAAKYDSERRKWDAHATTTSLKVIPAATHVSLISKDTEALAGILSECFANSISASDKMAAKKRPLLSSLSGSSSANVYRQQATNNSPSPANSLSDSQSSISAPGSPSPQSNASTPVSSRPASPPSSSEDERSATPRRKLNDEPAVPMEITLRHYSTEIGKSAPMLFSTSHLQITVPVAQSNASNPVSTKEKKAGESYKPRHMSRH